MSEKGSYVYNFDDLNRRISELEQIIKNPDMGLHKRIEELEAEDKDLWSRFKELEKKLEVKYENETGHALYHKNKLDPKIAELKEEMKIFKGAVINYNFDYDRIRQVREVLRELIKVLRVHNILSEVTEEYFLEKLKGKKKMPYQELLDTMKEYEKKGKVSGGENEPRENDITTEDVSNYLRGYKELISEFVEDIDYVWNNPNDFNKYMELKKKWEDKL